MDITKKYVLQFLHESKKHEEDFELDLGNADMGSAELNLDSGDSVSVNMDVPEAESNWHFISRDQGMSECMTFYCPDTVVIEDTGFMNAGANVHSPDDNAEEFVGVSDADNTFLLLYCPGEKETPYGFHFEMFEPGSLMVFDYAADIEELKEIVEHKFLRYTNYDVENVPFEDFEAKVQAALASKGESAEVDEAFDDEELEAEYQIVRKNALANPNAYDGKYAQKSSKDARKEFLADREGKNEDSSEMTKHYTAELIEMVGNDADLLLWYLRRHLSADGYRYFYEYVKDQVEREASDRKDIVDDAFSES